MGINLELDNCYIYSCGVVATKEEALSLEKYLDLVHDDLFGGEKTYQDGEKKMLIEAITFALKKANLSKDDLDLILGGDLSNQLTTSNKVATLFETPFVGIYSACATFILSLILSGIIIKAKSAKNILLYTSSNYGVAERQFRYPTTYGIQKKKTSTITVNGACAVVVSEKKAKIKVASFTIGRIIDSLSTDVNDMGSIMAIGAYDTLKKHLKAKGKHCSDYDLILTGDLSKVGVNVLKDMLEEDNEDTERILDAGEYIYRKNKNKFSGGSGPCCLPLVGFSHVINEMCNDKFQKVLFIATGSLHSKESVASKETIPVVAHAVELIKRSRR